MNDAAPDPLLELLIELGARAKRAERTVLMQQARIEELEKSIADKDATKQES